MVSKGSNTSQKQTAESGQTCTEELNTEWRRSIHFMCQSFGEVKNIAVVGGEQRGKMASIDSFVRALYPSVKNWAFQRSPDGKITCCRIANNLNLWLFPSFRESSEIVTLLNTEGLPTFHLFAYVLAATDTGDAKYMDTIRDLANSAVEKSER
jgi:hypothetical protein